jgi:hypothetical protein
MADTVDAQPDPEVVVCIGEFGPLNLQPTPAGNGRLALAMGRGLAADGGRPIPPARVRHLLAAYDVSRDRLSRYVKLRYRFFLAPLAW